jgi:hypothetical protein
MRHKLFLIVFLAGWFGLILVATAKASPAERRVDWVAGRLATHEYVCRNGNPAFRNTRWHCKAVRWTARELREAERALVPVGETEIRAYLERRVGHAAAVCLGTIIDWETGGTWDPTIDYGFGHGNVDEAYGLPQANPGTKMASAGPDWRTNPKTQIEWMIRYATERYGSPCAAFANRRDRGMY